MVVLVRIVGLYTADCSDHQSRAFPFTPCTGLARFCVGDDTELIPVAAFAQGRGFRNGSTPEPLFSHGSVFVVGTRSVLYLAHLVVDRGTQTRVELAAEYHARRGLDIGDERVVVPVIVAQ